MNDFYDFTPKAPAIVSSEEYPENVKTSPAAMERLTEMAKSSDEVVVASVERKRFGDVIDKRGGLRDLYDSITDPTPLKEMILKPAILPEGGLMVIVGEPKVGKSDYVMNLLVSTSLGESFLGITPRGPENVLYLQAEIDYDTMRVRMRYCGIDEERLRRTKGRFKFTPRFQECVFDDKTLDEVVEYCKGAFADGKGPGIICVDPLANVWDSSDGKSENNANDMANFINRLRDKLVNGLNPSAGLIVIHHASKGSNGLSGSALFDKIAGSSGLRRAYDTGIFITLADAQSDTNHDRIIYFETRCSVDQMEELRAPTKMVVYKDANGQWRQREEDIYNLDKRAASLRDARDADNQKILDFIYEEAAQGNIYEMESLCKTLEDTMGLGSHASIKSRVSTLVHKWLIKFTKSAYKHGDFPKHRGNGYLVVYDMKDKNGNVILPTHMMHRTSNTLIDVPTPGVWELKK